MANIGANAPPRPPGAKVIAFAVSIVQSKPPDLSVGEYIRLLRLHIAKGSRAGAVSSTYQHLDRSAYWRSESERMKSALKSSEDRFVDLQREVEMLKTKLDAAKSALLPTKKRKKVDDEIIPYPRSPKRLKADATSARGGTLAVFDVSSEVEFSQAGEIGNTLLRSLFQVHAILKTHNKIEPVRLAFCVVQASTTISQVVLDEIQTFSRSGSHDSDDLKKVFLLVRRAVTSIVTAFTRLSQASDEAHSVGKAIYAIVHMFRSLLAGLTGLSDVETKRVLVVEAAARKIAAEKSKSKTKTPRILNIKENPILSLYTTFLHGIMDLLDSKNEAHHELFEGFAFCVLERLGSRLYHSVFGHARRETLEEEIQQSHSPDDTDDNEGPSDQQDDRKQVRLEAPYLIALLVRIMAVAPSYLGAATSAKTGKPKQAHNKASMKGALVVEAKERLQRTLVTCIFGDVDGLSNDDTLAECLKMPVDKGSISMPKIKEAEVQEWFKEEMWRLLGWEILSKDGEW